MDHQVVTDIDVLMPKLSELELARILDHFRDCGADPKAIKKISIHISRLAIDAERATSSADSNGDGSQ